MRLFDTDRLAAMAFLLLLALGGVVTFWLQRQLGKESEAKRPEKYVDFIVDNAHLKRFDPQGFLAMENFSKKMVHYSDGSATVTLPLLKKYDQTRLSGILEAKRGQIYDNGDIIDLLDDVTIQFWRQGEKDPIVMKTEAIRVWREEQRAETNDPVVIYNDSGTVHAKGMTIDYAKNTFVLKGRVETLYRLPN
jgi:LPS export ABC transporter protein LptC